MIAFLVAAGAGGAVLVWAQGCHKNDGGDSAAPAETGRTDVVAVNPSGEPAAPTATSSTPAPTATTGDSPAPATNEPWTGPVLGAMAFQTPIYPEMRFGDERIGYIRQGGKVPVDPKPIKKPNCKEGWYHLIDGGYVCGKYATLDMEQPRVKLGVKAPDLEGIVPYKYAYNRFNGTPLYKELPTREEMNKYEPYLLEKKEKDKPAPVASTESADAGPPDEHKSAKHVPASGDTSEGGATPSGDDKSAPDQIAAMNPLDAGVPESPEEAQNPPPKPWWQSDEKNPSVTLKDLEADSDGNLAKRMVKGFFVAIDKTFGWNDRLWYRTTNGLVAPTDRMWINKPPESHGLDVPDGVTSVGFAVTEKAGKFELTKDGKKMKENGKLALLSGLGLTGKSMDVDKVNYVETTESGVWLKTSQIVIAKPGARPSDVGDTEKWVDVDLGTKTLFLMVGDKPVYSTLVSPGKRSRNKKKDHATPTGQWRIREKHVAVTMDGDGAGGDLPYSIDDVPYVEYFKGSYALHGAFWHSNFGREKSHGCVNLSPADAKKVFGWTEPSLPRGWHAVFATKDHPGSMVVIHAPAPKEEDTK
ncbi:MAG: L,D-transpeptidase family protein [Polyangiaceae bacterium]